MAFLLAYCNLYSYYFFVYENSLKKPFLYDTVKFPIYYFRTKVDSQILEKFILTFLSIKNYLIILNFLY